MIFKGFSIRFQRGVSAQGEKAGSALQCNYPRLQGDDDHDDDDDDHGDGEDADAAHVGVGDGSGDDDDDGGGGDADVVPINRSTELATP